MAPPAIGIDFGTTNAVIALATADSEAHLVNFPHDNEAVVAFRSALSFHAPIDDPTGRVVEAGPWAIGAYVEEPLEPLLHPIVQDLRGQPALRAHQRARPLVPVRGPALGLPAADARPWRGPG